MVSSASDLNRRFRFLKVPAGVTYEMTQLHLLTHPLTFESIWSIREPETSAGHRPPAMKTLGKFEILERIGQGAMGVVYKARDPRIGRLVALKTITTGLAEDPVQLEHFYREAHSAGALQHPNIVTIYELGEEEQTPFIAMEYLTGQSLDKLIRNRHKLPLSQQI